MNYGSKSWTRRCLRVLFCFCGELVDFISSHHPAPTPPPPHPHPQYSSHGLLCGCDDQKESGPFLCANKTNMLCFSLSSWEYIMDELICCVWFCSGYLSCCRFLDDNQIVTSSGDTTWWVWILHQIYFSAKIIGNVDHTWRFIVNHLILF